MEQCPQHISLATDIAVIKNDLSYIKERVVSHITEGETKGGFRDRLIVVEQSVDALKKAEWFRVIISGIMGGLIAVGSKDILLMFIQWVIKGWK